MVDFDHILDQAIEMLPRRGRLTYRTLRRQFQLDDAGLEDLKEELLFSQPVIDEEGRGIVWTGDALSISSQADQSEHLKTPAPEPLSYTPTYLAEKILISRSALEGERKQVTVLFCDLQNSTPLAEKIGPENMHALLNRFFELVLSEVHRYAMTVNQFLGDGFMAISGAPISHEDHARRAVLSAIGLQRRLKESNPGEPYGEECRFRIGINSDLVTPCRASCRRELTDYRNRINVYYKLLQSWDVNFRHVCWKRFGMAQIRWMGYSQNCSGWNFSLSELEQRALSMGV